MPRASSQEVQRQGSRNGQDGRSDPRREHMRDELMNMARRFTRCVNDDGSKRDAPDEGESRARARTAQEAETDEGAGHQRRKNPETRRMG